MASTDYTTVQYDNSLFTGASGIRDSDRAASSIASFSNSNYYAMRGVDVDALSLTYRSWVVSGSPDITGALYTGDKSGSSPLTNIQVVAQWAI
jgi:hypothetical protein